MQIKDLKINDEVSVKVSTQRLRDTDDEKWIYEPIFETAKVVEVDKDFQYATVVFKDCTFGEINADVEWYKVPSTTKIATHERPDTFTVEAEEEITEDTKIPTLIELFVSDYGQIIHTYFRTSIREAIGEVVKGVDALPKAFYILNDDYTMTLIWKDGELVK